MLRSPQGHPLQGQKILAIDWGQKFIGLATFHDGRDPFVLAHGRIKGGEFGSIWIELKKIISDESVEALVVGVPYLTDGRPGSTTDRVRDFLSQLIKVCDLPLFEQDETLSTFEAEDRMKNSPRWNFQVDLSEIDAVSATIILEDFLRSQGFEGL